MVQVAAEGQERQGAAEGGGGGVACKRVMVTDSRCFVDNVNVSDAVPSRSSRSSVLFHLTPNSRRAVWAIHR